ncbi:MAG: pantoate--beta-alanine ligase [Thiobacillus sp.]|nr:pantoate--beta-alanine ligase [Thiobacillus sp.]
MRIIHTVRELRAALDASTHCAFVPTMGNLHEGHIALVRLAADIGGPVVASIFVNPLQFGLGEDFERYPRTLAADADKLAAAKCDILFAPDVDEMYPEPQTFQVVPPLADELCGAFRPGHFAGVCTVVLKLFEMVRPRYAVFGKKDYQQLFLLKAMARQFNLPIEIIAGETIRADDGLALSSRNGYLTAEERTEAPRLNRQLRRIHDALASGNRQYGNLERAASDQLAAAGWKVDYISIRSRTTLLAPRDDEDDLVILGAAWLNKTRLIDNLEFS